MRGDEPDYEPLIEAIIMELDCAFKAGKIPSRLAAHDYAAPAVVAFWKHVSPSDLAFRIMNDAVRATFRELRQRGLLRPDPPGGPGITTEEDACPPSSPSQKPS